MNTPPPPDYANKPTLTIAATIANGCSLVAGGRGVLLGWSVEITSGVATFAAYSGPSTGQQIAQESLQAVGAKSQWMGIAGPEFEGGLTACVVGTGTVILWIRFAI